ncbi:hypothetical protein SKAU_G00062750 [Synaphobranchus kaupii]|uniref:Lipase domain-containing protein n=1 Tax=Synaphobranchus kaupii TaxID=118154 RepID=A0A9Q1G6P5_SYNKA|nr:hypothetical protein SKAU_G00062750 [Synaphobranchus kaupii]
MLSPASARPFYFSSSYDTDQVSKCDDFTNLDFRETFMGTNLNVKLLLFTRANLDCGQELSHLMLTDQSLFQLARPTAFVIHGYRPTGAPPVWVGHILRLLAAQEDMNILVVDWNRGAANLNYYTAVANTRKAAENITAFIQNMQVRVKHFEGGWGGMCVGGV